MPASSPPPPSGASRGVPAARPGGADSADRARVAADLHQVLWPIEYTDKLAMGACGCGCMVWPTATVALHFAGTATDRAIGLGFLCSLLPVGLFVIMNSGQELLISRAVPQFNGRFPIGTARRAVALDLLQERAARDQEIRKLLTALGETVRAAGPENEAGEQVIAELGRIGNEAGSAGAESDGRRVAPGGPRETDADVRSSSANTTGGPPTGSPSVASRSDGPASAGASRPPARPLPGVGGGVIPLDPFGDESPAARGGPTPRPEKGPKRHE